MMSTGRYEMLLSKPNYWSAACWNSIWISFIRTNICYIIWNRCRAGLIHLHGLQCRSPKRQPHACRISTTVRRFWIISHRMLPFVVCRLHLKRMGYRYHWLMTSMSPPFGTTFFVKIWAPTNTGRLCRKLFIYTIRRTKQMIANKGQRICPRTSYNKRTYFGKQWQKQICLSSVSIVNMQYWSFEQIPYRNGRILVWLNVSIA